MDIRTIALDMLIAIDRTPPSHYKSFEEYSVDYRMRWKAAMQLLDYAETMEDSDSESEYETETESDEESVCGKNF